MGTDNVSTCSSWYSESISSRFRVLGSPESHSNPKLRFRSFLSRKSVTRQLTLVCVSLIFQAWTDIVDPERPLHIKKDKFFNAAWKAWVESTKSDEWNQVDLPYFDKNPFKPVTKEHLIRMSNPRLSLIDIAANRCVDDKRHLFVQLVAEGLEFKGSVPANVIQALGMDSKINSRRSFYFRFRHRCHKHVLTRPGSC